MTMNPQVIGRWEGDSTEYGGPLYAEPDFTIEAPCYAADDIGCFKANTPEAEEFNAALELIHDCSSIAEVYRFRQSSMAVTQYQCDIERIQECMWEAGALMEASARCLEGANLITQIENTVDECCQHGLHIQQLVRVYEGT
jgi:hypothetical protein